MMRKIVAVCIVLMIWVVAAASESTQQFQIGNYVYELPTGWVFSVDAETGYASHFEQSENDTGGFIMAGGYEYPSTAENAVQNMELYINGMVGDAELANYVVLDGVDCKTLNSIPQRAFAYSVMENGMETMRVYAFVWYDMEVINFFTTMYRGGREEQCIANLQNVVSTIAPISEPMDVFDSASADFAGMSLDELIDLRDQIQRAMWETDEWQSVQVPEGVYEIGVDIPVGHWNIAVAGSTCVKWGAELDEYGVDIVYRSEIDCVDKWEDPKSVNWNLAEGTYLYISGKPVVFTPYAGKTDLGFR